MRIKEEERTKILTNAYQYIKNIQSALSLILTGIKEEDALKQYGLNRWAFRRFVYGPECNEEYLDGTNVPGKNVWVLTSEEECIFAFLKGARWNQKGRRDKWYFTKGCAVHIPEGESMPMHLDKTMLPLLEEMGSLETDVLRKRAVDGLSLEDIGQQYGYTRERIRQVESEAIRFMTQPMRMGIMTFGESFVKQQIKDNSKRLLVQSDETTKKAFVDNLKQIEDKDIAYLCLPVRPEKALRTEGIITIGQLLKTPAIDIASVRNMGVGSILEIDAALMKNVGMGLREINKLSSSLCTTLQVQRRRILDGAE